jgi:hypothetical protein
MNRPALGHAITLRPCRSCSPAVLYIPLSVALGSLCSLCSLSVLAEPSLPFWPFWPCCGLRALGDGLGRLGARGLHPADCRLQRTSTASNQYLTARESATFGGPRYTAAQATAAQVLANLVRPCCGSSRLVVMPSCRLAEEPPLRGLAGRGADS